MPASRLLLACLISAACAARAADCQFVHPAGAPPEVAWSGACKEGFAEGKGVLSWSEPGRGKARLEATLAHGDIQGEASLTRDDGSEYSGTFKDGVPDGKGYFRDPDGAQYEGDVRMGARTGMAVGVSPTGNRYVGEWKDGKHDGQGQMTYQLGGEYQGQWHDGERHGHGVLTYAGSGRRYEGEFIDGRVAGAAPAPRMEKKYDVYADRNPVYLPVEVARGSPVPADLAYTALTLEQQRLVASWFPALEEGDEPPYPLDGPQKFYEFMSRVTGKFRARGDLLIYANVGADGKVASVRMSGIQNPELRKYAAAGVYSLKYKPAMCRGQPCAMAFPFRLHLIMENR